MAAIINFQPGPVALPSGHVLAPATGEWTEDGFVCKEPSVLKTTNEVLRGDNAMFLCGPVLNGALAVEYDPDPPTSVQVLMNALAAQKAAAEAEVPQASAAMATYRSTMAGQQDAAKAEMPEPDRIIADYRASMADQALAAVSGVSPLEPAPAVAPTTEQSAAEDTGLIAEVLAAKVFAEPAATTKRK